MKIAYPSTVFSLLGITFIETKSGECAGWLSNSNLRRSISNKVGATMRDGAVSWCRITELGTYPVYIGLN